MMASSAPPALAAPRRSSVIQPCKGDPHLTLATLRGQMGAWQSKHPSTRTQTRSAKGYGAAAKGQMVDSDAVPALASGGGGVHLRLSVGGPRCFCPGEFLQP